MMNRREILRLVLATIAVLTMALGGGALAILLVTTDIRVAMIGTLFAAPAAAAGAGLFALIYATTRTCSPAVGATTGAFLGVGWVTCGLGMAGAPLSLTIGALTGAASAFLGRAALNRAGLPIRPIRALFRGRSPHSPH